MLSLRDPLHGFIRADKLEAALINSRPMQRLRSIRQLGFTHLVYPGAEHSRFSHVLGAMHLAGRVYDAVAAKSEGQLPTDPNCIERRRVRAAALVHDIGHAPFSHSAEDLFEGGLRHEEMTCRLLDLPDVQAIFELHGDGLEVKDVQTLLQSPAQGIERLLSQIVAGELDIDKMDYLQRDSLYCGVRYGSFDLDRLLDTIEPLQDPETGEWGLGVEEGGVHALEALIMARYYMFTQVYFNVVGKVLELHFNQWLRNAGHLWPSNAEAFLAEDDLTTWLAMRQSDDVHARALVGRQHFPLAHETPEHLGDDEAAEFEQIRRQLEETLGTDQVLVSHSRKDPHRLERARVYVRAYNGEKQPMQEASHFIRHLGKIHRYRVYAAPTAKQKTLEILRAAGLRTGG